MTLITKATYIQDLSNKTMKRTVKVQTLALIATVRVVEVARLWLRPLAALTTTTIAAGTARGHWLELLRHARATVAALILLEWLTAGSST